MRPLVMALPGNEQMGRGLAECLDGEPGGVTLRHFPDGETYVRIETPVQQRDVVLVCTLHRPDDKLLSLTFVAATARDLGAHRVGLVAPYLAYMRQDRRFVEGEGVTSQYFAHLLSSTVAWLVTVDPHLHRRGSLREIYSIPSSVVPAAPAVAAWIRNNVPRPLLIGPDAESAQWIGAVAEMAAAPFIVSEKVRRGDREVEVSVPELDRWRDHTAVLMDDIISTGRTMIATIGHLIRAGLRAPVCIGVHPVFAENAYQELLSAGAARVITCNTIPHPSNGIDLTQQIASSAREQLAAPGSSRPLPILGP